MVDFGAPEVGCGMETGLGFIYQTDKLQNQRNNNCQMPPSDRGSKVMSRGL